ncbi:MAG TPA: CoA-binding protein [Bacteroidales bacterium]|nr:MAG: hypothetical protein BWX63_01399 [Bacteroidetes bacterium ADurb.Bin041]HNV49375.1 CoA-binding protein [Bacteroidales bacterium]HPW42305.1 CoA-binding protein [Bacteroidales bacterium]
MAELKKTLVLGASPNPSRISFKAVNNLVRAGHPVVAVGQRVGNIGNIAIAIDNPSVSEIDTVTLYLAPENQPDMYDYILNTISPKRIIFNPGTENAELSSLAKQKGIETREECTLLMLLKGIY